MKPGSILKRKRWANPNWVSLDQGTKFIAIKREMSFTGMKWQWLLYDIRNGSLFYATEYWLKDEFEEIV